MGRHSGSNGFPRRGITICLWAETVAPAGKSGHCHNDYYNDNGVDGDDGVGIMWFFSAIFQPACNIVAVFMPRQAYKLHDNAILSTVFSEYGRNMVQKLLAKIAKSLGQMFVLLIGHDLIKPCVSIFIHWKIDWCTDRLPSFYPWHIGRGPVQTSGAIRLSGQASIHPSIRCRNLPATHGKLSTPVATPWRPNGPTCFS